MNPHRFSEANSIDSTQAAYVARGWRREGWAVADIARAAGLPTSSVSRMINHPPDRISLHTHRSLVDLDEHHIDQAANFIDSADARRLLEHLQYMGHAQQRIGDEIGSTKAWVSNVILGARPKIRREIRDRLITYYFKHRDEYGGSIRSRNMAIRRGWKPIGGDPEGVIAA